MFPRIMDVSRESGMILTPIDGYQNIPLLPLDVAVEPITSFFEPDTLKRAVWIAKEKNREASDSLTVDEAASIVLYTISWEPEHKSLYYLLNDALRKEKREKLRPWYKYLKLFLTALNSLPRVQDTVFRGVRGDISKQYIEGKDYFWWGLSSCTKSMPLLESPQFCGQEGQRTVFCIRCTNGRSIRHHSIFGSEEEILLLPGFYFQVISKTDMGHGLRFVQIEEKQPPHIMLPPPEKPGLHIESYCGNSKCSLYKRLVRVPFGYGSLDILADVDETNCKCPQCHAYVEPKNTRMINCWWRCTALKKEIQSKPAVNFSTEWDYIDGATYFPSNAEENSTVSWVRLIIETQEEKPPDARRSQQSYPLNSQPSRKD